MSYGKTLEELLVSTRDLPTELSFDEVEFLFLNPTPPPPAPPWWRRGGYLKFLLMFTLLISLLGFLLPTSADGVDYQLSAFPVQEGIITTNPVDSLPVSLGLTALKPTKVEYITPQIRLTPPKTLLAPAAAPKFENGPLSRALITDNKGNLSYSPSAQAQLPKALFTGEYSYFKDKLMLTFIEEEGRPVNVLFPELSPNEQRQIKNAEVMPFAIKRATGSLLLYNDGKTGPFEFFPNSTYRQKLNNQGWGDITAPENKFVTQTIGKPLERNKEARKALQLGDQMWLRYFSQDINDGYTGLLRQAGYNDAELGSLWKLVNARLGYNKLKELLQLCSAVLTDTPSLEALAAIKYSVDDLKKMKRRGERVSYEIFQRNNYQPRILLTLTGVSNDTSAVGKARRDFYAQNWSLKAPDSVSDTINPLPGVTQLRLKGNFKVHISEDTTRNSIIAYGRKNPINAMKKRSDYETAIITNKRRRRTIYLEVPQSLRWTLEPGKGIKVQHSPKR